MQQAITWANVEPDLCHHMVSLGHNELSAELFGRNKNIKILKMQLNSLAPWGIWMKFT